MPTNPNIILSGNQMAPPQLPDVNAMMQTRTAGLENIYNIEQQRAEQAKTAQKEQEAALVEALAPAYATAFKGGGSREAITAAYNLLPPEIQPSVKGQIDKLLAMPSDDLRLSALEASMAGSEMGRTLLDRIPTKIQELNAQIQQGQLDLSKAELAQRRAEAQRGPEPSYKEVVLEDGTLVLMDQKSGRIIRPSTEGPIDTAVPPQEGAPAPLKVKQKDGANTESERLAAYNSGRVLQAAQDIISAIQTDPSAISPGNVEAAVGNVADPNVVRSAERQQVVSAQRELIDALLTLATGAAYNREQREGQIEGFIPKWSDKPAQVKSKLNRTLKTIEIAKVKSGRAWTPEMDAAFQQLLLTFGDGTGGANASTPAPAENTSGFKIRSIREK